MGKMTRQIVAIFGGLLLLLVLSGASAAAEDSMPAGNQPMGGPNKMMDNSWLDNLVKESVITQATADKIKEYLQGKEAEKKEAFEGMKNLSEEERREQMAKPGQAGQSMWTELVAEGIITQSVADKIAELMPQGDEPPKQLFNQQPLAQQSTDAIDSTEIKVYINGSEKNFSPAPVNLQGSVLVPMRNFFEALGCEVEWDGTSQTAIGKRNGTEIKLPINQKNAYVDGQVKALTVEARIINDSTYIPLRFVGEALGAEVVWNNGTIEITQN